MTQFDSFNLEDLAAITSVCARYDVSLAANAHAVWGLNFKVQSARMGN